MSAPLGASAARRGSRIYTADVPARHGTLLEQLLPPSSYPHGRETHISSCRVLPSRAIPAPLCRRHATLHRASPRPEILFIIIYLHIARAVGSLHDSRWTGNISPASGGTRCVLRSLSLAVVARFIPRIRARSAAAFKHGGPLGSVSFASFRTIADRHSAGAILLGKIARGFSSRRRENVGRVISA